MRVTSLRHGSAVPTTDAAEERHPKSRDESAAMKRAVAVAAVQRHAPAFLANSATGAIRRSAQRLAKQSPPLETARSLQIPLPGGVQADVTVRTRRAADAAPMIDPATVREVLRKRLPSVVVVRTEKGLGSGYFVDVTPYLQAASGALKVPPGKMLILTNKHVVEGAGGPEKNQVEVDLYDKRTVKGEVVATYEGADAALVMVDQVGAVAPIPVGDRAALERGDPVLILGHPLGLKWSVTQGIISDPEREFPGMSVRVIQTDAAVNPGNSGGPMILLDREGRVIGTNSFKINRPGIENIAFAYHIEDQLRGVVQAWAEGRKVASAA